MRQRLGPGQLLRRRAGRHLLCFGRRLLLDVLAHGWLGRSLLGNRWHGEHTRCERQQYGSEFETSAVASDEGHSSRVFRCGPWHPSFVSEMAPATATPCVLRCGAGWLVTAAKWGGHGWL